MKKLLLLPLIIIFLNSCKSKEEMKLERYNDSIHVLRDSLQSLFQDASEKHGEYTNEAYTQMIIGDIYKAKKYADSANMESKKVNDFYNKMYPTHESKKQD